MDLQEKLQILADSAKYDASCSSSGGKTQKMPRLGSIATSGICHSYSSDGRCISLLKILFTMNCTPKFRQVKKNQCVRSVTIKGYAFLFDRIKSKKKYY